MVGRVQFSKLREKYAKKRKIVCGTGSRIDFLPRRALFLFILASILNSSFHNSPFHDGLWTEEFFQNSPVVSLMSKKEVNGFPSETRPYRISRGTPLSPSSAWTWRIWNELTGWVTTGAIGLARLITLSPGISPEGKRVTGGASVKTGATSCTSSTMITRSMPAMLRLSWPGSAYASCKEKN